MHTGEWPRVAVVGAGYWGRNLVRTFGELGALAAVVDANVDLARELAAPYGANGAAFEEVLADPAIAGLAIAAPAPLHHRLARRALQAGKHALVEKPLSLSVEEGNDLVALADERGLRLMVGHLLRYHPAFLAVKALVASGRLGRLRYIYSNRLSLGKIRREEDVLWSFAPHDLSMILDLVGEEPDTVTAFGASVLQPAVADIAQVQLAFPNGVRGHVLASWLHPFKEQRLVVTGENGSAVFEDSAADRALTLVVYPHAIADENGAPTVAKGKAETVPYPDGEPLREECRHFLDCIASGATPRTDGREGVRVLRVLERASAALRTGGEGRPLSGEEVAGSHPGVFIHESAYVDEGAEIGAGTKIWHFSHILRATRIGRNVSIGQNVVVGPNVAVGDGCKIQNNVSLYEGVVLEDRVFCGPSCVFTNVNNPRAGIERKSEFRRTLVEEGATIGANATIVCGHMLGRYCFIAAGAVVTGDVPPFALMAGVPARRIGWMSHGGHRLGPTLVCPESGRRYREVEGQLEEAA
jgi:predicted dehydrogenase/acetyltransferase-like isoleucine patch superfamily enzyme